jgi:hypothetical protein
MKSMSVEPIKVSNAEIDSVLPPVAIVMTSVLPLPMIVSYVADDIVRVEPVVRVVPAILIPFRFGSPADEPFFDG